MPRFVVELSDEDMARLQNIAIDEWRPLRYQAERLLSAAVRSSQPRREQSQPATAEQAVHDARP